jgi:hypothetical protein
MEIRVPVEIRCGMCGEKSLKPSGDTLTDSSEVKCASCGTIIGTWGEVRARVQESSAEQVKQRLKNRYRAAKQAFSVIDFHDVRHNATLMRFQEEEQVPHDSKVIGQTWAKANKDGSRDRRFANNYQIPIVAYASLSLKSNTGLWEDFQFSNPERLAPFLRAWDSFVTSFASDGRPN